MKLEKIVQSSLMRIHVEYLLCLSDCLHCVVNHIFTISRNESNPNEWLKECIIRRLTRRMKVKFARLKYVSLKYFVDWSNHINHYLHALIFFRNKFYFLVSSGLCSQHDDRKAFAHCANHFLWLTGTGWRGLRGVLGLQKKPTNQEHVRGRRGRFTNARCVFAGSNIWPNLTLREINTSPNIEIFITSLNHTEWLFQFSKI